MRGLTSHARHLHGLGKEDLSEIYKKNEVGGGFLKILGGIGIFLLALITAGKFK